MKRNNNDNNYQNNGNNNCQNRGQDNQKRVNDGALWYKTSKNGVQYLVGYIECKRTYQAGERLMINVLKNKFQDGGKPDCIIIDNTDQYNNGSGNQNQNQNNNRNIL